MKKSEHFFKNKRSFFFSRVSPVSGNRRDSAAAPVGSVANTRKPIPCQGSRRHGDGSLPWIRQSCHCTSSARHCSPEKKSTRRGETDYLPNCHARRSRVQSCTAHELVIQPHCRCWKSERLPSNRGSGQNESGSRLSRGDRQSHTLLIRNSHDGVVLQATVDDDPVESSVHPER